MEYNLTRLVWDAKWPSALWARGNGKLDPGPGSTCDAKMPRALDHTFEMVWDDNMLKLNSWKSDLKTRCFMMFLFSIVFVCLRYIQSKHIQAIQYTSIHISTLRCWLKKNRKHSTCSTIFWVSVVAFATLPPVPSRGGPWPPEAATTSSGRPTGVCSARCGTCCGRCPARWPRRTSTAAPRCTTRRSTATPRSAGCCWRLGPMWAPVAATASRPWRDGCTVLWGDFRVQKKIEIKMWNDVKWCEM